MKDAECTYLHTHTHTHTYTLGPGSRWPQRQRIHTCVDPIELRATMNHRFSAAWKNLSTVVNGQLRLSSSDGVEVVDN